MQQTTMGTVQGGGSGSGASGQSPGQNPGVQPEADGPSAIGNEATTDRVPDDTRFTTLSSDLMSACAQWLICAEDVAALAAASSATRDAVRDAPALWHGLARAAFGEHVEAVVAHLGPHCRRDHMGEEGGAQEQLPWSWVCPHLSILAITILD